ncbi:gamma-glutamylcyclotransferase [Pseudooceanicola sp.]|uniref:gamma-glutamylcyclotransferase n=1 Tax=Pseudooceanicola sp. TaxID=1914328 RepID=UPI00405815EB
MPLVFAYGTLRHGPLMEIVAGESVTSRPAALPGFAVKQALAVDYPALVPDADGRAEGTLYDVSDAALDRLDWYESISDYPGELREVEAADGPVTARVWMPGATQHHDDAPWRLDAWVSDWGDLLCRAAAEAMEHRGRVPVETVSRFWGSYLVRAAAAQRAAKTPTPLVGRGMRAEAVQVEHLGIAHSGFFLTRHERLRYPTFHGGLSETHDRETFVMADACVVLPYDPQRDRVLLTEQFRMGPWARGDRYPWVLEPVAGRVDPGESPETCALRECVEEAGVEPHELLPAAHYYPSTGAVSEYVYSYVGLCDLPDLPSGGGGLADEGEDIRTLLLSFDEAMDLVSSGEANDGPLILLMLWLQRERPRLRATA